MSPADEAIGEFLENGNLEEALTRGMKRAMEKYSNARVCQKCQVWVPKYPGRYPRSCPECGMELEDLQNSPVYSEASGKKDRTATNAKMRRVPQDRIPLSGTPGFK